MLPLLLRWGLTLRLWSHRAQSGRTRSPEIEDASESRPLSLDRRTLVLGFAGVCRSRSPHPHTVSCQLRPVSISSLDRGPRRPSNPDVRVSGRTECRHTEICSVKCKDLLSRRRDEVSPVVLFYLRPSLTNPPLHRRRQETDRTSQPHVTPPWQVDSRLTYVTGTATEGRTASGVTDRATSRSPATPRGYPSSTRK